ncbi:Prostaglandin reductase 1 [Chionoecetes opilio]|uniref:Prostaglandin reductase 1 n=1 Tax=Chionoecetes opilio TaxID=41210 RepID=A0A8J5D108_CHIOP|nr:Prostaglandin reductase 1 [Chionoecetes opilio]
MAEFGRVSVCGAVSTYNDEGKHIGMPALTSPFSEATVIWKQLRFEGFIVTRWNDRWMEGIHQLKAWIVQGKLKNMESVVHGFDKMPSAFIGLFHGDNTGKAVVVP